MIIARWLSPEKCDTVFNFTSLTINGLCVVSSSTRCCNSFLSLRFIVCILQLVLSSFFGNFFRKMVQREEAKCISDFCEWITHTCCRRETVIKLNRDKKCSCIKTSGKACKILRIFHWFANVTTKKSEHFFFWCKNARVKEKFLARLFLKRKIVIADLTMKKMCENIRKLPRNGWKIWIMIYVHANDPPSDCNWSKLLNWARYIGQNLKCWFLYCFNDIHKLNVIEMNVDIYSRTFVNI